MPSCGVNSRYWLPFSSIQDNSAQVSNEKDKIRYARKDIRLRDELELFRNYLFLTGENSLTFVYQGADDRCIPTTDCAGLPDWSLSGLRFEPLQPCRPQPQSRPSYLEDDGGKPKDAPADVKTRASVPAATGCGAIKPRWCQEGPVISSEACTACSKICSREGQEQKFRETAHRE